MLHNGMICIVPHAAPDMQAGPERRPDQRHGLGGNRPAASRARCRGSRANQWMRRSPCPAATLQQAATSFIRKFRQSGRKALEKQRPAGLPSWHGHRGRTPTRCNHSEPDPAPYRQLARNLGSHTKAVRPRRLRVHELSVGGRTEPAQASNPNIESWSGRISEPWWAGITFDRSPPERFAAPGRQGSSCEIRNLQTGDVVQQGSDQRVNRNVHQGPGVDRGHTQSGYQACADVVYEAHDRVSKIEMSTCQGSGPVDKPAAFEGHRLTI